MGNVPVDRPDESPAATAKEGAAEATARQIPDAHGSTASIRAVTINRPASELFAFWRDFSNLASFMENVVRIDVLDEARSHWVVRAPGGGTVEWDARVTAENDGRSISWTSEEGADVPNSGAVEFIDAGARGTVVTATILYDPPAGTIGKLIAKVFQREPAIQARRDLRRFKQLMETGEIATGARNIAQHEKEAA